MGASECDEEIRTLLHGIIEERDRLRVEWQLSRAAIVELENQNIELSRLLSITHDSFRAADPKPAYAAPNASFIGLWECLPAEYPSLVPMEDLFRTGQKQRALNAASSLLGRRDLDDRHRANGRLLYAAILQSTGSNLRTALAYAEEALQISYEVGFHQLVGKANFWRGLCHLSLDEFANAKWCLTLASHLAGHTALTEDCRSIVEQQLERLPGKQRVVTSDFKFFCSAAMEDFVRRC